MHSRIAKLWDAYVDRSEASTVAGGHVLVKGIDGLGAGHLAVLLVHVVGTGARVVTDPDTEVLDLGGSLLVDLWRKSSAAAQTRYRECRIHTSLRDTISPALFLTFLSFFRKYQKRDLATTVLDAKRRIR